MFHSFIGILRSSIADGIKVSADLFRFLIPLVIIIKILSECGVINYIAMPLKPLMTLMGMPAELGLAWAAAMLINVYSGLIVLLGLLPALPPLSVEQATIFALLVLIAHSLVLETRIAGQCHVGMTFQCVLRIVVAVLTGLAVHGVASSFGFWQEPARILLAGSPPIGWTDWAVGEILNLIKIFVLVCCVMLLKQLMDILHISDICGYVLRPVLHLLGISRNAASVIIVGFCMGIIYGSGVIIKSVNDGSLSERDVFGSMPLMSIAHSLIEDSLLLLLVGGSLWGILGVRLCVALLVGVLVNVWCQRRGKKDPAAAVA